MTLKQKSFNAFVLDVLKENGGTLLGREIRHRWADSGKLIITQVYRRHDYAGFYNLMCKVPGVVMSWETTEIDGVEIRRARYTLA